MNTHVHTSARLAIIHFTTSSLAEQCYKWVPVGSTHLNWSTVSSSKARRHAATKTTSTLILMQTVHHLKYNYTWKSDLQMSYEEGNAFIRLVRPQEPTECLFRYNWAWTEPSCLTQNSTLVEIVTDNNSRKIVNMLSFSLLVFLFLVLTSSASPTLLTSSLNFFSSIIILFFFISCFPFSYSLHLSLLTFPLSSTCPHFLLPYLLSPRSYSHVTS